nr:Chain F, Histone H3.1 peptide with K9A mutation [Homo sapiens]5JHN_G Chain G, Histone H3.1 peptide with K9A mutation [Homo sapiens]
TKQTARASTGG